MGHASKELHRDQHRNRCSLEPQMKSAPEIRRAIREIREDDRMKARPALVHINAALALIQCNLEGQLQSLRWVLGEVEGSKG